MADLLAVLYDRILRVDPRDPQDPLRDRFLLSKGHGAAILYAVLAEKGFFTKEWLDDYARNDSLLTGHISHHVPGVEVSTGSLGHALPIACGMALAGKRDHQPYRVFVLLSDGELDEGSNWEALLFAPHHQLDHLIVIVDYNKLQSFGAIREVLDLEPLLAKFQAFRWAVREIDGHDLPTIETALRETPYEVGKPSLIIAHTIKGKGVSFMENQLAWHYQSVNAVQLAEALAELEGKR
jgi:transketolase